MDVQAIVSYGGISAVFGFIKSNLSEKYKSVWHSLFAVFVSVSVGEVAGLLCESFGLMQETTFAFVAGSAILADSIVIGILNVGEQFQKDPIGVLDRLRRRKDD